MSLHGRTDTVCINNDHYGWVLAEWINKMSISIIGLRKVMRSLGQNMNHGSLAWKLNVEPKIIKSLSQIKKRTSYLVQLHHIQI